MLIPLLLDRGATVTLERQIAAQIAELMRGGRLRPGARLPSTRVLADDPAGLPALRAAIAGMLGPARGIAADPDQIVVTAGIQEGINIAARLFVDRDTTTAAESPCYQGAAFVLRSTGGAMIPIAVDAGGLDPNALPNCRVALLYVTPSHQYPTGATLAHERRHALIAWARRIGCYILEDDYDSDFRYDGPPLQALAALAPDCVIYLGTFSKSLGAGLRLGYMVLPRPIAPAARAAKTLLNNGNPWLEQAALAEMIQSGTYSNHLLRIRRLYMQSRDLLVASLQEHFAPAMIAGTNGGLHVLWRLPESSPEAVAVEAAARRVRVGVYTMARGGVFDDGGSALSRHALILGYAAVAPARIGEGIARLAAALSHSAPMTRPAERPDAAERVA
jgi:GntR family transcriptional regulator/MocR family aminotransferase